MTYDLISPRMCAYEICAYAHEEIKKNNFFWGLFFRTFSKGDSIWKKQVERIWGTFGTGSVI